MGAAFKVNGDFKDAWSSAFRLRDSEFKVLEIATRLMTSRKRRAQRPFEFVFVLSDCSLLQGIKKEEELAIAASKITIYSKSEASSSLKPVLSTDSLCVFASQDAEWVEEEPDAEINSGASKPRSRC